MQLLFRLLEEKAPLTGEAYGCCKSTTFFIRFFMV